MIFEGQTVLLNFTPYTLYYKLQSELARLKNAKSWIFFHLVKFQFKTFGNMHHPNATKATLGWVSFFLLAQMIKLA